jgi:hypothetical protein
VFDQGRLILTVVMLGGLVLGAEAYAQPADYVFEFSLDIGSDTEMSDPFRDGNEGFDPGDIYRWQSSPVDPPGRDGFKDDLFILGADPWPNPPDPSYATAVPVGTGGIEGYWNYLDVDGHDQLDVDLYELQFIPPGWPLDAPIPRWESPCIHGADYLMISYDDDMAPGWPAADVPVTAPSPSGVSSYGTTSGGNEIVGLNLMTWAGPPPYLLLNVYPIASEVTVHQSLRPNPDNAEEQDDDIDSLDIVPPYGDCPVWYFSADHEGHYGLDPGGIYEVTSGGPVQIIDEFIHLGLPEDTDIDAFEFAWLEDPQQPGTFCFALLFSVDDDDPLTPWDETGTLPPNVIFGSFLTGWSFQVLQEGLDDDIDALTAWYQPVEVAQPTGACCLPGCDCELLSEAACVGLGGSWAGVDTDCTDADGDGVTDSCFTCVGDTNCDGSVNLADLAQLLGHYGQTTGMDFTDGDLDGDGDVDLADLAELLGHYGTTCWGACCVVDERGGYECVATNAERQCLAMGGQWYHGEDCFGDPPFECPDTITIEILTDDYGDETTWELFERATGTVVASEYGPLEDNELYRWYVAVDGSLCYDWIIYDDYGDGICCDEGDGYFEVSYNGELVCEGGEFEYEDRCRGMGAGCVDFVVEAPYTSPIRTTCDAGDDCDMVPTSPDHEYEVIIPHAGLWSFNTCLHDDPNTALDTYIFLGTSLCSQDLGSNDDACGVDGLQSEVLVQLEPGNYFCTIEHYCCDTCGEYIFDVHEVPSGACCVDAVCVATNFQRECEDLGGSFFEGETCPEYECPETDADFIVQAPYTSSIRTTCGAGYDCDMEADSPDHEYEVIIPYAGLWNFNTCLHSDLDTEIFVGTTLCSEDIGSNDDTDGCGDDYQSEVIAYLEPGNYFCTIEHYCCDTCGEYVFDVHEIPLGACCVDEVCEATNTEAECDDLGGIFFAGETCPEFECPCVYCTPCFADCGPAGPDCPDPTSTPDDWITNVTFNTINNDTYGEGCPCSYGDYSDMSTTVEAGATYTLSVTFCSEGEYIEHVSAWFDWNQNCVFEEGERYYLGSGINATLAAEITVPVSALQGATGMRVIERYDSEPTDPCEDYDYGEAEDYTVIVGG